MQVYMTSFDNDGRPVPLTDELRAMVMGRVTPDLGDDLRRGLPVVVVSTKFYVEIVAVEHLAAASFEWPRRFR